MKKNRKVAVLILLAVAIIVVEAIAAMEYGWKEAFKQSPLALIFIGAAVVQIWDFLTTLIRFIQRPH